jgi:hypothetical protein
MFEHNHVFLRAIEQVSSSNGVKIFTWLDYCSLSHWQHAIFSRRKLMGPACAIRLAGEMVG